MPTQIVLKAPAVSVHAWGNKCTDDYISIQIDVDNEDDTTNDGHTSVEDVETNADGAEGIDGDISSETSVALQRDSCKLIQFKQKRRPRRTAPMMYCSKRLFEVGEKKRMTTMNYLGYMLHLS